MFKSFTCFLKCAYVEAIRKMINPQALSQFLTVLECVLINSRRQVISETHGILKTQLPCYKQTEREMLAISNSGIAPEFLSPESKELLASWEQYLLELLLVLFCIEWLFLPSLAAPVMWKWKIAFGPHQTGSEDFFTLLVCKCVGDQGVFNALIETCFWLAHSASLVFQPSVKGEAVGLVAFLPCSAWAVVLLCR